MCRIYGFLANEETKVECTLVYSQNALLAQSRQDLRGKSHPDGWGIAFYHGPNPELERRAAAAFSDVNFSLTAERVYSKAVIAHVRMATVGGPSLVNTHPFSYGVWAGAHNGTVMGFQQLSAQLAAETGPQLQPCRVGATDSEQAFYWLLTRLMRAGVALDRPCPDLAVLVDVVAESVAILAERCDTVSEKDSARLNFLLTDGQSLVASRWHNSLYWVARDGIRDCQICGIPHVHHETGVKYRAAVIASEPLSHEAWQELADESVIALDNSLLVLQRSIR